MRFATAALILLSNINFEVTIAMATTPRVITPIPAVVSGALADCLKQFQSRDVKEQANIIRNKYTKNAIFADPIMKVKGTTNIQLQFYSLIKIFTSVVIEEKSLTVTEGPEANTYKADLENHQTYVSRREGFLSRHLMPEEIKINVRTTLIIEKDTGMIKQHLEKWHDKKAPIPGFMKPFNGWFSANLFKLMGWGKDIKASPAQSSKTAFD